MNYDIIFNQPFAREVKRLNKKYHSLKSDLWLLEQELLSNPNAGVDLGNGVHKVRMAIGSKGRGKSHGARVITVLITLDEDNAEINLLYIYDKADRDTISPAEIENLLKAAGLKLSDTGKL